MQVIKYTGTQNKGNLLAYVNFYIPTWDLFLNDCKLMRAKDGERFIGFPSRSYEHNGETKYFPYVCFGKNAGERFKIAALAAIDEHVSKH